MCIQKGPLFGIGKMGRGCPLCPGKSDIDLLCDFEGIINFYAKVTNRALNLGMSEE